MDSVGEDFLGTSCSCGQHRVEDYCDKPTEWVNSLVIVEKKDGSLRLCLDPKDLNIVIRREHFQISTFEDVVSRLRGKKCFTVLDQKDSYEQVP